MARARNIKPAIMDNDKLGELEPITRLLFIYLWMLADRNGRIEDRPKRIAAQALPYDRNADVNQMLNDLQSSGFVERYEVDGVSVIQVLAFEKHQTPHIREAESQLPAKVQGTTKAQPRHNLGEVEASPRSPESGFSDSLIPDSLIADTSSVAKATGGKPPMAPDEIIFGYGLPLLTNAGTPERQARSFLGGLRKAHGDDALIDKLRDCIRAKPLQPLEWLAGALPPAGAKRGKQPETFAERDERAAAEKWRRLTGNEVPALEVIDDVSPKRIAA